MAFVTQPPPGGDAFWNQPMRLVVIALVALPAIPAAVWCGAVMFKAAQDWLQGFGL